MSERMYTCPNCGAPSGSGERCDYCGAPSGSGERCDYCGAPNPYYEPDIFRRDAAPVTLHETEVVECRIPIDPSLAAKLSDAELIRLAAKGMRDKLLQALLRNTSVMLYQGDASTNGAQVLVGRVHVVKHNGVMREGVKKVW